MYGQGRDEEALGLLQEAARQGADLPLLQSTLRTLQEQLQAPSAMTSPSEASEEPRERGVVDAGTEANEDAGVDAGARSSAHAGQPEPASAHRGPEPPSADRPEPRYGPCVLPLERLGRGRGFLLNVIVNGLDAQLVVDTGASLTVITRELAGDLGVPLDDRRSIVAITANGRVNMPTAVVSTIDVGGYAVDELRVAVCDGCVEGVADGLLGLDIQTVLQMRIDPAAGVADFAGCF